MMSASLPVASDRASSAVPRKGTPTTLSPSPPPLKNCLILPRHLEAGSHESPSLLQARHLLSHCPYLPRPLLFNLLDRLAQNLLPLGWPPPHSASKEGPRLFPYPLPFHRVSWGPGVLLQESRKLSLSPLRPSNY